jgi:hypothetical protein
MKTFEQSIKNIPIINEKWFLYVQDWRYSKRSGVALNLKTHEVFRGGFYELLIEKGIWNSEMLI